VWPSSSIDACGRSHECRGLDRASIKACPPGQRKCAGAKTGGRPEIDADKLDRVTFYTRTLAVPARRDVGRRATDAGERHFRQLGCESCHLPELRTGDSDVAGLEDQLIRPYTDAPRPGSAFAGCPPASGASSCSS